MVKKFYLDDENSRMMPRMKDFVSVIKDDGSPEHVQKKLILCNLSEYMQIRRVHSVGSNVANSIRFALFV